MINKGFYPSVFASQRDRKNISLKRETFVTFSPRVIFGVLYDEFLKEECS